MTEMATDLWTHELLDFPARHLAGLPEACTFTLYLPATQQLLTVATSELSEPREAWGALTLDIIEWAALVRAVEWDRFLPEDLMALCEAKEEDPRVRLELDTALAGAEGVPHHHPQGRRLGEPDGALVPAPLPLGEVLGRLGAELLEVSPANTDWSDVTTPMRVDPVAA